MKNQLNKGASGHARGFDSTFDRNAAEELGEGLAQQPQASTELASLLLSIKIQNDLQTQKTNEVLKGQNEQNLLIKSLTTKVSRLEKEIQHLKKDGA